MAPDYRSFSAEDLVRYCARSGEDAAWEEFVSRFDPVIGRAVRRAAEQWGGAPVPVLAELVQQTYERLLADNCRRLREFVYQGPGSIYGYLMKIARNATYDYFASQFAESHGGKVSHASLDSALESTVSDRRSGSGSIEREVLLREIYDLMKKKASGPNRERDIQIFFYHYMHGMSARAIAQIENFRLRESGVESVISGLIDKIKDDLAGGSPTGEGA